MVLRNQVLFKKYLNLLENYCQKEWYVKIKTVPRNHPSTLKWTICIYQFKPYLSLLGAMKHITCSISTLVILQESQWGFTAAEGTNWYHLPSTPFHSKMTSARSEVSIKLWSKHVSRPTACEQITSQTRSSSTANPLRHGLTAPPSKSTNQDPEFSKWMISLQSRCLVPQSIKNKLHLENFPEIPSWFPCHPDPANNLWREIFKSHSYRVLQVLTL